MSNSDPTHCSSTLSLELTGNRGPKATAEIPGRVFPQSPLSPLPKINPCAAMSSQRGWNRGLDRHSDLFLALFSLFISRKFLITDFFRLWCVEGISTNIASFFSSTPCSCKLSTHLTNTNFCKTLARKYPLGYKHLQIGNVSLENTKETLMVRVNYFFFYLF